MTPRIPGQKPGGQQSLMDLLTPSLQAFVENLPILGDIVEAFTGREDGDPNDIGSKINAAKAWVAGLFGRTTSLASRVSAIEGKIATGAEGFDDFNRGNNPSVLGAASTDVAVWTQGGDGQPLGINDQAAQITQGGLIAQAGRRWAKYPKAASGNTFTISMVTHPVAPSQFAETWLFARMNDAFTEGLAARMVRGKCWLSRVSRPSSTSNTWTVVDIVPPNTTKSYSQSATVEFKGEESVLQLIVDSDVVLSASDSVHAIDSAHRANGFAAQTTTLPGGFSPSYSGGLASYSLKSVAQLASVVDTAGVVATAKVAPVAAAVTAGASGAAMPVDADPVVYAATKSVSDAAVAASTAATSADTKATSAQNSVQALINGGVRTIYTSNFTYIKPLNLVKLGVIIMGGGGSGTNGTTGNQPGGTSGSYIYSEYPASAIPSSVPGTIGPGKTGGSNDRTPGTTSFGSLLTNLVNGSGAIASSTGFINASDSAPGAGGACGLGDASGTPAFGSPGGSSALASGGAPGTSNGAAGQPGGNAPTTGQTLAGGGGGGGGYSAAVTFAAGGAGGAGGFPGGAGGAGGRGAGTNKANGGPGAPGIIALIEFLS